MILEIVGGIYLTFCGYTFYRERTKKKREAQEKREGMHK